MVTKAVLMTRTETRKTQGFSQEQLLSSTGAEKHKARMGIPQLRVRGRITQVALYHNNLLVPLFQGLGIPTSAVTRSCCNHVLLTVISSGSYPQSRATRGATVKLLFYFTFYHKPCLYRSQTALLFSLSCHTSFLPNTSSLLPSITPVFQ